MTLLGVEIFVVSRCLTHHLRALDALYKGLLISLVHGNNHAKLHKRDMLIRRVRHNNPVKSVSNSKIACDG